MKKQFFIYYALISALAANTAHAGSMSGIYNVKEKFTDGSTLAGQITYNADSNNITAAALQLSTPNGAVALTTPYQAYHSSDGFAQKVMKFDGAGMVSVTLVLNTDESIPKFIVNVEDEGNNYIDSTTATTHKASICGDAGSNQITPAATAHSASEFLQLNQKLSMQN
ncbi:MAG: hypothetical protein ABSB19_08430 [Methylomonas sp.]